MKEAWGHRRYIRVRVVERKMMGSSDKETRDGLLVVQWTKRNFTDDAETQGRFRALGSLFRYFQRLMAS